jgi:signal transduction histidine kinase
MKRGAEGVVVARGGSRRGGDTAVRDFVFLQRLARAADADAAAGVLAEECWHRGRQPAVVLLRRSGRWRLAAVVGCKLPALDERHLDDIERWLAAVTVERPWRRFDVPADAAPLARLLTAGSMPPMVARALVLQATPFFERACSGDGADLAEQIAQLVHDLKQPLASMSLSLDMLNPTKKQAAHAERCRRSIAAQWNLVEDVLTLFGKSFDAEPVVLEELLAEIADDLLPQCRARRVTMTTTFAAGATVTGDRRQLRRALANVVDNAIAMSPDGGEVGIALRRPRGGGAFVEIHDSGPGVPRELRDKVFEPFFTKRPGGTGLGLAVARSVVERHGGTVQFLDGPGGRVRFTLPNVHG